MAGTGDKYLGAVCLQSEKASRTNVLAESLDGQPRVLSPDSPLLDSVGEWGDQPFLGESHLTAVFRAKTSRKLATLARFSWSSGRMLGDGPSSDGDQVMAKTRNGLFV
jgi:hypothetical protein